jgi:hypothetical protein
MKLTRDLVSYIQEVLGRRMIFIGGPRQVGKTGDQKLSPHLRYFRERLPIPVYYQVHLGEKEWNEDKIKVRRWESFWKERVQELRMEK